MTRSSVRNFVIAVCILILFCGGLAFLLFEIDKQGNQLREQLTSIEVQNKRESAFYKLEKTAEESSNDRLAIEKYFLPQSSDSIDFLNRVEELARVSGVILETDTLEEVVDKKAKQKYIEAKFSFSGSQEKVEQFIKILETLPYLSKITNATLTVRGLGDWEAKVTMRVFILNYEI